MNLIAQIEAEQIAALGKTIPDFKAGDTVRVGYKVTEGTRSRVQNYEGVVIGRKGGATISRLVHRAQDFSFGEGVERVFPLYSTNIDSIEVVRRGRVRRAKLYYLRDRRGKSARISEDTNYKAKDGIRSGMMKQGIHPEYHMIDVKMTDGTVFQTKTDLGQGRRPDGARHRPAGAPGLDRRLGQADGHRRPRVEVQEQVRRPRLLIRWCFPSGTHPTYREGAPCFGAPFAL